MPKGSIGLVARAFGLRSVGVLAALVAWLQASPPALAAALSEVDPSPAGVVDQAPEELTQAGRRRVRDPYRAYDEGLFDQALQGFVDQRVERPEEPGLALNVGSAHYKMGTWREAERAFSSAAATGETELREQALYNLGNTAYRQGRLEEAVELFRRALELDPDDQDAKFNLEFVRDEIRRRHEEARERQQQQQPQGDQGQEGDQQTADQGDGQQSQSPQPSEQESDRDSDGLADQLETSGENPTDPGNPDSDGDGLSDGEEDANRNGRVDPGETDPNRADSDGDGAPDGGSAEGSAEAGGSPLEPADLGALTPEEAERYLQALEEGRPPHRLPVSGRPVRPEKDW